MSDDHVHLYTDGGARGNPGPAGAGAVIKKIGQDGKEGEVLATVSQYLGETTNNQAEYQALLLGLQKAKILGVKTLKVFLDSELVVKQLNGVYKVKHPDIAKRFLEVHNILSSFSSVSFHHVPREKNTEADRLVNQAIDAAIRSQK